MEKKEKKLIEKAKWRNGLDNIKTEFVKVHSTNNEHIPRYLFNFLGVLASMATHCFAQCLLVLTDSPAKRKNSIMSEERMSGNAIEIKFF